MLETLKGYDPAVIQNTLANASTFCLPVAPDKQNEIERLQKLELVSSVMKEVRRNLGLSENDFSSKALNRIQRLLFGELAKSVLYDTDESEIKTRLGQNGVLSPRSYEIKFSVAFKDANIAVTEAQTTSAIRNADHYQHLHPDKTDANPENSVSLFTKIYIGEKIENNYTLLVVAQRKGFTQLVNEAWIVYHNEVDITEAKTPLDILKIFVKKYGEELTIGDKTATFFWMETIPIKFGQTTTLFKKEAYGRDKRFIITGQSKNFPDKIEVAHAYGINYDSYVADLKKHGISVKRAVNPPARFVQS